MKTSGYIISVIILRRDQGPTIAVFQLLFLKKTKEGQEIEEVGMTAGAVLREDVEAIEE